MLRRLLRKLFGLPFLRRLIMARTKGLPPRVELDSRCLAGAKVWTGSGVGDMVRWDAEENWKPMAVPKRAEAS